LHYTERILSINPVTGTTSETWGWVDAVSNQLYYMSAMF